MVLLQSPCHVVLLQSPCHGAVVLLSTSIGEGVADNSQINLFIIKNNTDASCKQGSQTTWGTQTGNIRDLIRTTKNYPTTSESSKPSTSGRALIEPFLKGTMYEAQNV